MDEDNRIIDLDSDNSQLPDFFSRLEQPINMTLCAGDGNQEGMTDIEWFVTRKVGYNRENKPTTIFITTKNYADYNLIKNKEYLRSQPDLKVILLVYNDENPKWKENLVRLFPGLIKNIYEDNSCYGDKLDLKTLNGILREGGIYHMEHILEKVNLFLSELHPYKEYLPYFTIDLSYPFKIIKDNGNKFNLPEELTLSNVSDNEDGLNRGLNRFKLDILEYGYRTTYNKNKNKPKAGGKKTKKTKKSRKIKSNKTKKTKKSRKIKTKQ